MCSQVSGQGGREGRDVVGILSDTKGYRVYNVQGHTGLYKILAEAED